MNAITEMEKKLWCDVYARAISPETSPYDRDAETKASRAVEAFRMSRVLNKGD